MFDIHEKIVNELFEKKSIAAFIWLICQGRELELSYYGTKAFVSKDSSKYFVSLWVESSKQAFSSVEELWENAVVSEYRLCDIWERVTLDTLF